MLIFILFILNLAYAAEKLEDPEHIEAKLCSHLPELLYFPDFKESLIKVPFQLPAYQGLKEIADREDLQILFVRDIRPRLTNQALSPLTLMRNVLPDAINFITEILPPASQKGQNGHPDFKTHMFELIKTSISQSIRSQKGQRTAVFLQLCAMIENEKNTEAEDGFYLDYFRLSCTKDIIFAMSQDQLKEACLDVEDLIDSLTFGKEDARKLFNSALRS